MGRIRERLTYANVMATIAVFLALGGGIAWALASNSVKSRHIKDGQVKPQDLNSATKPQVVSYTAATGDNVQEEVISHDGYRVLASCDSASGGRPELEFFLEFPEDGRLYGFVVSDPSDAPTDTSSGPGSDVVGGEVFSAGGATAPAGESDIIFAGLRYLGGGEGASLDLHLVADDDADECVMRGMLIPGVIPPA
jgi:hypothetical protein